MTSPTRTRAPGTAIATRAPDEKPTITTLIDKAAPRLTPLLPAGLTLEALREHVYFAAQQTPEILKCSGASIVQAVQRALRSNLEIGATCYLIPFKGVCTFVADYKGLAQLMIGSGAVRAVEASAVYAGDEFEFEKGLNAVLRHRPCPFKERGEIIGAYVILRLPFGASTFEYMAIEDIDQIRHDYSRQWAKGPCPSWYAKKTCIRQVAKLLPKDPRLTAALCAIAEDEAAEKDGADAIVEGGFTEIDEPTPAATIDDTPDYQDDTDLVDDEFPLNDARPSGKNAVSEGH